jgi:hypothetical protein
LNIAFIGNKGHGKTTAAKYLVNNYGYTRMSFADPVKDITVDMLNVMRDHLHMEHIEIDRGILEAWKQYEPVRKLLQLVGTELGRDFFGEEDIWVKQMERKLEDVPEIVENKRVVIDDLRFINEAEMLRERGFTLVLLDRPDVPRIVDMHASEQESKFLSPNWHVATYSIQELYHALDRMMIPLNLKLSPKVSSASDISDVASS